MSSNQDAFFNSKANCKKQYHLICLTKRLNVIAVKSEIIHQSAIYTLFYYSAVIKKNVRLDYIYLYVSYELTNI